MAQTLTLNRPLPPLSRIAFAVAQTVLAWENRRHTRTALKRLDDHMLRDIGLDPIEADDEVAKPFWQS